MCPAAEFGFLAPLPLWDGNLLFLSLFLSFSISTEWLHTLRICPPGPVGGCNLILCGRNHRPVYPHQASMKRLEKLRCYIDSILYPLTKIMYLWCNLFNVFIEQQKNYGNVNETFNNGRNNWTYNSAPPPGLTELLVPLKILLYAHLSVLTVHLYSLSGYSILPNRQSPPPDI